MSDRIPTPRAIRGLNLSWDRVAFLVFVRVEAWPG
jgi:hypothetical protein